MNNDIDCMEIIDIKNPARSKHLITQAINFTKLNLNEITIFTETGSGYFVYTPIIAAMAGAKKVYAIIKDSKYGSKNEIKENTLRFAEFCEVKHKIEVVFNKNQIHQADIVTNLGFVRPIDKNTINSMKKGAVISYMCEAWEFRNGDVDLAYARKKGIPVMGVNEHYKGLDVFNYCGLLAMKMLFDTGIEIYKNKIVIVSSDEFGKIIFDFLSKLCDELILIDTLRNIDKLKNVDAIIIADYTSTECFIGDKNSQITCEFLKKLSDLVTIIQFAGKVNVDELKKYKINFYPQYEVGSFKMGKTLAYLGPKPIIDLHCAGLKVGEIMYKTKNKYNQENTNISYIEQIISEKSLLCQKI